MGNIGHYINGNNVEGKSGLNKPVFNPAQELRKKMLIYRQLKKSTKL